MKKSNIILFGIALSAGLMACGNNGNGTDSNGGMSDSSSTNMQMMDSANNMTPAQGMGDSTLYRDSGTGSATGSGNDGVLRNGGSSTSTGDSARGGGGGNQ